MEKILSTQPIDYAYLREVAKACPWKGPWVHRTFEVECPCPNGVDCGESHSCEEVTDFEAYPRDGDGQCVVAISVPGLESLAGPCAKYIASVPPEVLLELLDRLERYERNARVEITEKSIAFVSGALVEAGLDPISCMRMVGAALRKQAEVETQNKALTLEVTRLQKALDEITAQQQELDEKCEK